MRTPCGAEGAAGSRGDPGSAGPISREGPSIETSTSGDASGRSSDDEAPSASPTLLSRDEEAELAEAIRAGALAESQLTTEPPGPARDDLERTVERGKKAREDFIEANRRLVHWVVRRNSKKYAGRGLTYEQMVAAGEVALVIAVDRFDGERGTKFSTFAVRAIEWSVDRALRKARADANRARKKAAKEELDRQRDVERQRAEADSARYLPEVLEVATKVLDERQRGVLIRRRGLDGEAKESLRDLEERVGISYERIRVIEREAVGRLRASRLLSAEAMAWLDSQGTRRGRKPRR